MPSIIGPPKGQIRGNKQTGDSPDSAARGAAFIAQLAIAQVADLRDSAKLRAAFIARDGARELLLALAREPQRPSPAEFVAQVERVADGKLDARTVAATFTLSKGYGREVMLRIVELAAAAAAAGEPGPASPARRIRRRLATTASASAFEGQRREPGERRRWRSAGWRRDAAETVVSIGTGRCLLAGCSTLLARDGQRHYCSSHATEGRKAQRRRHDARLANAADLLAEVGRCLRVGD